MCRNMHWKLSYEFISFFSGRYSASTYSTLLPFYLKPSHSVLHGHCSCLIDLCPSHTNDYIQHFEYHSWMHILFFLSYDIIIIIAGFLNTTEVLVSINKSCYCGHRFPEFLGFLSMVVILPGRMLSVSGSRHF